VDGLFSHSIHFVVCESLPPGLEEPSSFFFQRLRFFDTLALSAAGPLPGRAEDARRFLLFLSLLPPLQEWFLVPLPPAVFFLFNSLFPGHGGTGVIFSGPPPSLIMVQSLLLFLLITLCSPPRALRFHGNVPSFLPDGFFLLVSH